MNKSFTEGQNDHGKKTRRNGISKRILFAKNGMPMSQSMMIIYEDFQEIEDMKQILTS